MVARLYMRAHDTIFPEKIVTQHAKNTWSSQNERELARPSSFLGAEVTIFYVKIANNGQKCAQARPKSRKASSQSSRFPLFALVAHILCPLLGARMSFFSCARTKIDKARVILGPKPPKRGPSIRSASRGDVPPLPLLRRSEYLAPAFRLRLGPRIARFI